MTDQATNQKLNPVSEKLVLVSNQWRLYSISITTIGTEFQKFDSGSAKSIAIFCRIFFLNSVKVKILIMRCETKP